VINIVAYIDDVLVFHVVEHVRCQFNYDLEGLVQEVRLQTQLKLCNVLSGDALLVQLEQPLPDNLRVNVFELDREEHLHVPLELLEHGGVAILQVVEELLQLLKYELLRLRRVDPLGECVKDLLLVDLSVLLPSEVLMHAYHTSIINSLQGVLHRAVVQIQIKQG